MLRDKGLLGVSPLRPHLHEAEHSERTKVSSVGQEEKPSKHRENKTHLKKIRFTPSEAEELDAFLKTIDTSFSEFVREAVSLRQSIDTPKRKKTVTSPAPSVDPELLFELGRIGNNINQISRSLHIIKNDHDQATDFSFVACLNVLQEMQVELNSVIGRLPEINRSEQAVERARKRALERFKGVAPDDD